MHFNTPPFPLEAIRAKAQQPQRQPIHKKRTIAATLAAGFSLVAIAAAAEIAMQSHIRFTPSGGFVLSSSDMKKHDNPSDADIQEAASRLNFHATLPAGLPSGTKARYFQSSSDLMTVAYDLPGAWRSSHHLAWIFLANHDTVGSQPVKHGEYTLRPDRHMSVMMWRIGNEEVFVVSNGLTRGEAANIKQAMLDEQ